MICEKVQPYPCMMYYITEDVDSTYIVTDIRVPTREEHKEMHSYEPSKIQADYDVFVQQYVEREKADQTFVNRKPRKVTHVAVRAIDDPIIKITEQKDGFVQWVGQIPH